MTLEHRLLFAATELIACPVPGPAVMPIVSQAMALSLVVGQSNWGASKWYA